MMKKPKELLEKCGDLIEITNCISLGISDKTNLLRAIYVRKVERALYFYGSAVEVTRSYIKDDETLSKECFPNMTVTGHVLYIRPEDKDLLKFTNGIFIPYETYAHDYDNFHEYRNLYFLRDYPSITDNFHTIRKDTEEINVDDYVIRKDISDKYIYILKVVASNGYRSLMIKPYYEKEKENGYNWSEELNNDKLFKITNRIWD